MSDLLHPWIAGAVYLMLKAINYFVGSLWSAPAVQAAVAALRSNLNRT